MNAVISDADTLEAFTAAAKQQEGPVVMLNLLKFKEGGGALEYATYGGLARKIIEEIGGRPVAVTDDSAVVDDKNRLGRPVDNAFETLLADAQGMFESPSFG